MPSSTNTNPNTEITLKKNGRGAYLKRSHAAFEKAKQKKLLARALQVEIPEEIFSELEKYADE